MSTIPLVKRLIPAPKFHYVLKLRGRDKALDFLDIGCGNHSPSLTKTFFPQATYSGVDIQDYNIDDEDRRQMDHFYLVNADGSGYDQIPDGSFDVVIANHVFEHMRNPLQLLPILCRKLRNGGLFYAAFPSEQSLGLPSAVGTLNFCDDTTHVFLPSVREMANALMAENFRIIHGGYPRCTLRYLISFPCALAENLRYLFTGRRTARGVWPYYGFEVCVVAEKRAAD